jgi:DNA-binding MarR family transcriptional regulator
VLRGLHEANQGLARRLGLGVTYVIAWHGVAGAGRVGDRLGMRSASATALVDRLEAAGHVQRQPHPSDRRRLLADLEEPAADHEEAAADLSPDQQEAVARYLERVAHALHTYGQHQPSHRGQPTPGRPRRADGLPGQALSVAAQLAGWAVVGQGGRPEDGGGAVGHRAGAHSLGTWPGGVRPGHTAFTSTRVPASSAARVLVRAFRAALLMP